jgi:deazaflavin-dependent oxidoreductase (nitroreductase family)
MMLAQPGEQQGQRMSFQTTPGGTRGARGPGSNAVTRAVMRAMTSWHRRSGDKFQGQDLLYLTTVGAKTGRQRQSTVARFPDGEDAWLVVASAGGSAHHPAWYHNIAAHPDQVRIEFGGRQQRVTPTRRPGRLLRRAPDLWPGGRRGVRGRPRPAAEVICGAASARAPGRRRDHWPHRRPGARPSPGRGSLTAGRPAKGRLTRARSAPRPAPGLPAPCGPVPR